MFLIRTIPSVAVNLRVALLSLCCLAWAPVVSGQPTHAEVFLKLAKGCLETRMDSMTAYGFATPNRLPFLRDQLGAAGLMAGDEVYLADSLAAAPVFHLQINEAAVTFTRGRRRTAHREVSLVVDVSLIGPDRRLIEVIHCDAGLEDVVPRSRLDALASDLAPETRPAPLERRWVRRILEPTAAVTATVLGAYLFFTLRSDRSEES